LQDSEAEEDEVDEEIDDHNFMEEDAESVGSNGEEPSTLPVVLRLPSNILSRFPADSSDEEDEEHEEDEEDEEHEENEEQSNADEDYLGETIHGPVDQFLDHSQSGNATSARAETGTASQSSTPYSTYGGYGDYDAEYPRHLANNGGFMGASTGAFE
jgi:hypothetical protein